MSSVNNQDATQQIEPFLKSLLQSLDNQYSSQFPNVESYATQFAKQLKPSAAIIINGKPLIAPDGNSKLEFQKKWFDTPQTNHQLNSFDCHLIPGTGTFIVSVSGKMRFDESGKNRLGETANIQNHMGGQATGGGPARNIWGSWFGYVLNIVVDDSVTNNIEAECISSFNYRFTYKPEDSVIQI